MAIDNSANSLSITNSSGAISGIGQTITSQLWTDTTTSNVSIPANALNQAIPSNAVSFANSFINSVSSTSNQTTSPSSSTSLTTTNKASSRDTRVRLSAFPNAGSIVYGAQDAANNILTPLYATNGMIFPYTPSMTMQQDVNYNTVSMIHTNMDWEAYQRTPSVSVTIAGKFTIQNQAEGLYCLAAIHFMRTVSKMYFGEKAGNKAGLPPPLLLLNGYGTYVFNNIPVIVKSHSYTFDESVDTILINAAGGNARLPVIFTLSVSLTVQQTPTNMRTNFDLDAFRTGKLMKTGGFI